MPTLQEIALKTDGVDARLVSGHRMCAGCGIPAVVKTVLAASDKPVIVLNATGCLEVTSAVYPFTAWNTPWMHLTFENAAAVAAGVESAYKALKRRGKVEDDINILAVGGDGGTYDIGFQALSGALERRHKFMYLAYDNEGYMNTGNQRSGATPFGASTTTVPAGKASFGKPQWRKNLVEIAAAHRIPYVGQGAVHNILDLYKKAEKGFKADGPAVLAVLQPCTTNWAYDPALTMQYSKLAVETNFWPLYEVENGVVHVNVKPANRKPVEDFLKGQSRFKHLFKPENQHLIAEMQQMIDLEWARLLKLEETGVQL
ncbi:MAG TPA: thiamine pyrophosphate-dependent enzyme [Candidatus Cryosericum sp.]|jgi:pyruvate ferredoxin oxidoreductase beta subunit|nr:thiamine pyrophosphate-dependent enzyme [Candidatus Cryosericum sp.]